MIVLVNERPMEFVDDELTVGDIVSRIRPNADTLVLNGFPATKEAIVQDGDTVVVFCRGIPPTADELDALLSARHTPGVAQALKSGRVGIAGLGGLGSAVAIALARVGVGSLVLVDFDVVEPTNINRQQYFLDQLGLTKVEALSTTLRRIRPSLHLIPHVLRVTSCNVVEIFDDCHVVVEAFDRAEAKVELIETLQTERPQLPIVAGSGMAGYDSANLIRTVRYSTLYVCGDGVSEACPGHGLMAPRVGVAAHHQANQVLRLLMELDD